MNTDASVGSAVTLPTPEEMYPKWEREAGKKGRKSKDELNAERIYNAERDEYAELLKLRPKLAAAQKELAAATEEIRRLRENLQFQTNETTRLSDELRDGQAHARLLQNFGQQLQYMLGKTEVHPGTPSNDKGGPSNVFVIGDRGTATVIFGAAGYAEVRLELADSERAAVAVPVLPIGIPADSYATLQTQLGLRGKRVPCLAARTLLRKKDINSEN
jgi:hypothetical protein